jgi:MFS family permease
MLLWLSLTHQYRVALFCLAMSGLGMTVFFSTINTMVQTSVPDALRGRVMGVWALLFGGMMPIGAMEAGSVAHYFGVSLTIGTGAVVCGLAALAVWIVLCRRKVSA